MEEAEKSERQVSTSDPQARLMVFADRGRAAGYNVQIAADGWFVVGLAVTDRRNDSGLAAPMMAQLVARYERVPSRLLVDSKLATQKEIVALDAHEQGRITVYAPVPEDREDIKPASRRRREKRRQKEPEALRAWRARMQTADGEAAIKRRRRIETLNGILKNRGMGRMLVRGIGKVRCCVLLQALANNLMQAHRLRSASQPA